MTLSPSLLSPSASPLPIAAPSWVLPGTVAENARFLAGRVAEVGICCFEAESSAAMSEEDLPARLAELPLRWHLHLPSDLDPGSGRTAARAALRVWERAAFLRPRLGVLHLPPPAAVSGRPAGAGWLRDFLREWSGAGRSPRELALENVRGASPLDYRDVIEEADASLCLDMGHAMAYGQEEIPAEPDMAARVILVHWSAPGSPGPDGEPRDRHLPLTDWTPSQKERARVLTRLLPPEATHLVEVFRWDGVRQSWPVLREALENRGR